ncbi:hypothetical protein [Paracraurococcus lichenis]|uniref:Glycosyltransferase n=1 Tax=Paracraurococcus lichenis TaxID=3064888 RepID=A0ABT9E106_9PROT|nr:hypothetical protein [Paracraurococcus sp. LOR1-02]MDO9709851.1 hypothetical protein [Paracraurococcus sp. LOR1-02]
MATPMPPTLPRLAALRTVAIRPRAVVVVLAGPDPVLLVRCLGALALQRSGAGLWLAPEAFGVVVAPDGAAGPLSRALERLAPALPFRLRLMPEAAAPGWALRAAMEEASAWLGGEGPILVTEARAVPEPRWVARAFTALAGEADLVLGEVVPPGARPDAASRHAALLARLGARLDPDPIEPAPRPALNFGIRAGLLAAVGGLPAGTEGGLPGLLAALRRRDARIRRAPGLKVEAALPPALVEPAFAVWRRLRARRALRQFWTAGTGAHAPETPAFRRWAARLGLPAGALGRALAAPSFGLAWAAVAAASPVLAARRSLPPAALRRDILLARLLLALPRPAPIATEAAGTGEGKAGTVSRSKPRDCLVR